MGRVQVSKQACREGKQLERRFWYHQPMMDCLADHHKHAAGQSKLKQQIRVGLKQQVKECTGRKRQIRVGLNALGQSEIKAAGNKSG